MLKNNKCGKKSGISYKPALTANDAVQGGYRITTHVPIALIHPQFCATNLLFSGSSYLRVGPFVPTHCEIVSFGRIGLRQERPLTSSYRRIRYASQACPYPQRRELHQLHMQSRHCRSSRRRASPGRHPCLGRSVSASREGRRLWW